jgi:hypothetical protein
MDRKPTIPVKVDLTAEESFKNGKSYESLQSEPLQIIQASGSIEKVSGNFVVILTVCNRSMHDAAYDSEEAAKEMLSLVDETERHRAQSKMREFMALLNNEN